MSVSFLSDSTPPARFSQRHPRALEIVPSDPPADRLKSQTDDRCISPTGFRRFLAPAASAQTQKNKRDKACDRWNQQRRDIGEEISPAAEVSRCRRPLRLADNDYAQAHERVRRHLTNREAQPALRLH